MTTPALMIGAFHEMVELCRDCEVEVRGILDPDAGGNYFGVPVLGTDADADEVLEQHGDIGLIITPDGPNRRQWLASLYTEKGARFISLVSPGAAVSPNAELGTGVVIQHGCNVSPGTKLGDFVRLNVNANVMHDSAIGNFTTVAPNAVVLSNVRVGERSYLGANCTILPSRRIGCRVIVGAGAVVTKDVPDGSVVFGNPARPRPGDD